MQRLQANWLKSSRADFNLSINLDFNFKHFLKVILNGKIERQARKGCPIQKITFLKEDYFYGAGSEPKSAPLNFIYKLKEVLNQEFCLKLKLYEAA